MPVREKREWTTALRLPKAAAEALNIKEDSVLVASTGVIGMQRPHGTH